MSKYYYYLNGPYGLVDLFRKNIWINLHDEAIAHAIRKTFAPKVGLVVYDLSVFENYSENPPLVDIDCCFDWRIGIEDNESLANINLVSIDLTRTQKKNSSPVLINRPIESLLSTERIKELQEQMCLYVRILQETHLHLPLDPETVEENRVRLRFEPGVNYDTKFSAIYQEINTIFSRDLYTETIEISLKELANTFILNEYPDMAFKILKLIDKVYE